MAIHAGRFKLGSKPAQLYVRLCIILLSQKANHISSGIIKHYVVAFVCLYFIPYRIPECSIRSKSFTLCERQPWIPSPECSTLVGERIYCHPQTDCLVVSQLFSVARHAGRLKLGLKPAQLYVRLSIILLIYTYIYIYIVFSTSFLFGFSQDFIHTALLRHIFLFPLLSRGYFPVLFLHWFLGDNAKLIPT